MKQHPPFSIQIELVEGCSLACVFCGINAIRKRPGGYKFMALHTIKRIARQIQLAGWDSRIEFAMHGEPSLHPKLVESIACFRDCLPNTSLMMTSNGIGFAGINISKVQEVFDAGLNILGLDLYDGVQTVPKIVKKLTHQKFKIPVRYYPENKEASIHRKRKSDCQEIVILEDVLSVATGNHSKLFNHAGQAAKPDYSKQNQRCAFPFRELSFRWDGNVSLCCDDFRGVYKIANINDLEIEKLWQHQRFRAARKKLYHGMRDFKPCYGCNAVSYRVGLLPDTKGQETLPKPTELDDLIISRATSGKSYTKPIKRDWEK